MIIKKEKGFVSNKVFSDDRGIHMKFFQTEFAEAVGFGEVKEIFSTINNKGTVRAFHFQADPHPQQKIIKPLSGAFNVRVIDPKNKKVLEYNNWTKDSDPIFIREGNFLGYVSLEDESIMLYIADADFNGSCDSGVHPLSFGVNWEFDGELIMSDRDAKAEIRTFD